MTHPVGTDVLAARPVARPGVKRKPIYYSDWQRHWYRLLDYVQPRWQRFRWSRTGRFIIWTLSKIVWLAIKLGARLVMFLASAICVVGLAVLLGGGQAIFGKRR